MIRRECMLFQHQSLGELKPNGLLARGERLSDTNFIPKGDRV